MQPKDAANAMTMMSDKLSDSIQEMPDGSVLDKLRIEACKQICQDMPDLMVVLCSDMGTPEQNITYCKLSDLPSAETGRLHSLVIPAKPGDVEEMALNRWGKK
jgi:diphthamide biosynthesis methyltransferase